MLGVIIAGQGPLPGSQRSIVQSQLNRGSQGTEAGTAAGRPTVNGAGVDS